MKICLINPPKPNLGDPKQQFPLGLLYLKSFTNKNIDWADISIVDYSCEKGFDFIKGIPDAELYGLTSTTLDYDICVKIASELKQLHKNCKVILGGPHASSCYREISSSIFDSCIIGEGELSFLKLLYDLRYSGRISPAYSSNFIEDIDTIPYPDRASVSDDCVRAYSIFAFGKTFSDGGSTSILTSRGCPYACGFCASNKFWKRKVRYNSVEYVIGEINQIINDYGIRQLRFQDDTFSLNKVRLFKLCDEMEKLNIYFRCSLRVNTVDREILGALYRAGCREVGYGIESMDQRVLNLLCKGTTVEQNYEAIKMTKEFDILARIFIMTGTPGETKETVDKNIEFFEKAAPDIITLNLFAPLPGSEIFSSPERYNCTVLEKDYRKYCFNLSKHKECVPNVLNNDIGIEEMTENINRMRRYIFDYTKVNTGVNI